MALLESSERIKCESCGCCSFLETDVVLFDRLLDNQCKKTVIGKILVCSECGEKVNLEKIKRVVVV